MTLYIVGHRRDGMEEKWEFCGVFDDYERAVKECHGPNYFVGVAALNESWPEERHEWERCYYPLNPNSPLYIGRICEDEGE
jgi:hypothetical protein